MKAFLCFGKQAEDPVPGLLSCGIMKRSPSPPRGSAVTTVNVNSKSNIGFADGTLSRHRETVRTGRVDEDIPRRQASWGSKQNVVKAHRVVGASVQVKAEDDGHATGLTCLPSRAPPPVVPEKVVGIHAALSTSTNATGSSSSSSQTPQTQALPSSSCENLVDAMHARPSLQSVSFTTLYHLPPSQSCPHS